MRPILLAALLLATQRVGAEETASPVGAAPVVLRAATIAPDGSAWAREFHAFARDVESRTQGRVRVKWYLNAVAGGELEMGERLRRRQLDFVISGGGLCSEVMPTTRVLRLPGLFQDRHEARHVMFKLQTVIAAEARESGFVYLGGSPMGSDRFFLRQPVHSLAELRGVRLWSWDQDAVALKMRRAAGFNTVPTDVGAAGRAFDEGRIDGFFALPTAALAFQWSIRAPYLLDYKESALFGCVLFSGRSFYGLTAEDQKILSTAMAHLDERFDDVGAQQEAALLGGAFQHQGVKLVPVSASFRAELFAAVNAAREREGPKLVPKELIQQVQAMLADYRAEHTSGER